MDHDHVTVRGIDVTVLNVLQTSVFRVWSCISRGKCSGVDLPNHLGDAYLYQVSLLPCSGNLHTTHPCACKPCAHQVFGTLHPSMSMLLSCWRTPCVRSLRP